MRIYRLARWVGVLFAVALLLPLAAACLLYVPAVQEAAVRWASAGLTQHTGIAMSVEGLRLAFPLRMELKGLRIGTLLSIEGVEANVRLRPLLRGVIRADYASAEGIGMHLGTTREGAQTDLWVERFRADDIAYHGRERELHIQRLLLSDGDVEVRGGSMPHPKTARVIRMPLSLDIDAVRLLHIGASYAQHNTLLMGLIDEITLHDVVADTALHIALKEGEIRNGECLLRGARGTAGDLQLTGLNARVDSLRYGQDYLTGQLTHLACRESHGIALQEGAATVAWQRGVLSLPQFELHTEHSSLQGHLYTLDYGTRSPAIDGDADLRIGHADMLRLAEWIGRVPKELTALYPTETLRASLALDGTMERLQLTRCAIALPTAFEIAMDGMVQDIATPRQCRAQGHIVAHTYDLDFLAALMGEAAIRIPSGIGYRGDIVYAPDTLHALCTLSLEEGTATVEAGYRPTSRAYTLRMETDSLDMQLFVPQGAWGRVSMLALLEGRGMDYRHEETSAQAAVQLRMLQWRGRSFTNIAAQAVLDGGELRGHATCNDSLMQWHMATTIKHTPSNIRAQLYAQVDDLDMLALQIADTDIRPTLRCHATLRIDSGEVYSLSARLTDIALTTPTRHVMPRTLSLQGTLTPDTALLAIHSGDLTLMASAHTEALPWQWQRSTNPLANLAQLQAMLTAGSDNPVSNYLSLMGIEADSLILTAHYTDDTLHAHLQSGRLAWRTAGMMLQGSTSCSLAWREPYGLDDLAGVLRLASVRYALPTYNLQLHTADTLVIPLTRGGLTLAALPLYTTEGRPLLLSGTVGLFGNTPTAHLRLTTSGTNLLQRQATREAMLYGKAIVSSNITLDGPFDALSIAGDLRLMPGSSIHYRYRDAILTASNQLDNVVTFVSFDADTLATAPPRRRRATGSLAMNLNIAIDPTAQLEVTLGANQQNRVALQGGGVLNLQYMPITGLRLAGRYTIETGSMNMNVPLLHVSNMTLRQGSTAVWSGNVLNPLLDITAEERVRASVTLDGSPQSVVFIAGVSLTNTLEKLNIQFTLSAPENASMQNTLAALSPEERGKLSVALLTTGLYLGEGGTGNLMNTALMGFLQAQIDNISRDAFRTVDVSVGIEPLPDGVSGVSTRTDYSFSIAKRLWDNRIRIIIGGSVTTNNERIEDNAIIDNISIEWRINPVGNQYLRFFYNKNYESILEGEIRETGVGYAYRRRF